MKTLQEAKELLSHSLPEAGWAEVIAFLAMKQIKKVKGSSEAPSQATQGFFAKPKRKYITLATRRAVFQRANNCCEYISANSGKRCENRYQLQVDHRVPLARGGGNDLENLRALCRTHNLLAARQWGLLQNVPKQKTR